MTDNSGSNLFHLKLTELINTVSVDYDYIREPIEKYLHGLRDVIDSIPEQSISCQVNKVVVGDYCSHDTSSATLQSKDKSLSMQFIKPAQIDLCGSYLLQAMVKPYINVDMIVEIPQQSLNEKDYLNYRYFDKRAMYLSVIATSLYNNIKKGKHDDDISIGNMRGNPLKPIIIMRPNALRFPAQSLYSNKNDNSRSVIQIQVRIIPVIAPVTFKLSQLLPSRGNIRNDAKYTISMKDKKTKTSVDATTAYVKTPLYNHDILQDMYLSSYLPQLHQCKNECQNNNFTEAIILLRIWATQRGILGIVRQDANTKSAKKAKKSIDNDKKHNKTKSEVLSHVQPLCWKTGVEAEGWNSFLLTMMMLHCYKSGLIQSHMSALNMFCAVLNLISAISVPTFNTMTLPNNDNGDGPIIIAGITVNNSDGRPSKYAKKAVIDHSAMVDFQCFDVIMICPFAQKMNLTSRVSRSAFLLFRHHALMTLRALSTGLSIPLPTCLISNTTTLTTSLSATATIAVGSSSSSSNMQTQSNVAALYPVQYENDAGFANVFLTKINAPLMYDVSINVSIQNKNRNNDSNEKLYTKGKKKDDNSNANMNNFIYPLLPTLASDLAFARIVYRLLSYAFNDRIFLLDVAPINTFSDVMTSDYHQQDEISFPSSNDKNNDIHKNTSNAVQLSVRLLLHPDNAIRTMDMGPSSQNDAMCKAFRSFWGNLSELRRFKDGSICEVLPWETKIREYKSTQLFDIFLVIAKYILPHHLSCYHLTSDDVFSIYPNVLDVQLQSLLHYRINDLERALKDNFSNNDSSADKTKQKSRKTPTLMELNNGVRHAFLDIQADSTKYTLSLTTAFDGLAAILRGLGEKEGLPLSVTAVHGVDAAFYGCSTFMPVMFDMYRIDKSKYQQSVPVLEVVCGFEHTSVWPLNDFLAMARIKTAFYLKMGNILRKRPRHPEYGKIGTIVANDHLDIFYRGFCFRIRILNMQEIAILQSHILAWRRAKHAYIKDQLILYAVQANHTGSDGHDNGKRKRHRQNNDTEDDRFAARFVYMDTDADTISNNNTDSNSSSITDNSSGRYKLAMSNMELENVQNFVIAQDGTVLSTSAVAVPDVLSRYSLLCGQYMTLKDMVTTFYHRVSHAADMRAVQHKYPVFTIAVRVCKRWIQAHMLGDYLQPEAIELLVAYCFTHPAPYASPHVVWLAFYRFVNLLCTHSWNTAPLIVDVTGDMSNDEYQTLVDGFNSVREYNDGRKINSMDIMPYIYIATVKSQGSNAWTIDSPNAYHIKTIEAYAKATCLCMQQMAVPSPLRTSMSKESIMTLFVTPVQQFDLFIELDVHTLPLLSRLQALHSQSDTYTVNDLSLSESNVAKSSSSNAVVNDDNDDDNDDEVDDAEMVDSNKSQKRVYKSTPGSMLNKLFKDSDNEDFGDFLSSETKSNKQKNSTNDNVDDMNDSSKKVKKEKNPVKSITRHWTGFSVIACLMKDLQYLFRHRAEFFYDYHGGRCIFVRIYKGLADGALVNMTDEQVIKTNYYVKAKSLQVNHMNLAYLQPNTNQDQISRLQLNIDEMIAHINCVGQGVIKHVHTSHDDYIAAQQQHAKKTKTQKVQKLQKQ